MGKMTEFIKALVLIFIAEMGDKTQIIAMTFATKFKVRDVLLGVLAGVALNHGIAVLIGAKLGQYLPMEAIQIFAGFLFLFFGVTSLKREEDDDENKEKKGTHGPIIAVALAFFIGEMGDKTQLTAMTLATESQYPLLILMGTTAGMILTSSFGIFVGSRLGKRISEFGLKIISSAVFILFGSLKLIESLPKSYVNIGTVVLYLVCMGLIEGFMLKPWIAERRSEKLTKYQQTAERLKEKRIAIRQILKKSCVNDTHCEACKNKGCLLSYVNKLLKAAEMDESIILASDWDNIPKPADHYKEEKLIEALQLILTYYAEEGWIEAENHIINRTRESVEILIFGNKLEPAEDLADYITKLKEYHPGIID